MKPSYSILKLGHYSSNANNPSFKEASAVYTDIGYDPDYADRNPGYENTCAIRMSLALLSVGMVFEGRFPVKAGRFKGRSLEQGAIRLADKLRHPDLLGKPEVFLNHRGAIQKIGNRRGIVFFHTIAGYGGGHIDLYEPVETCNSDCYFSGAREIWFWPLPP